MIEKFRIYSEMRGGKDGIYSVRLMLTDAELRGLQAAGVVGEVAEIVGMQTAADALVAQIEMEGHICMGGLVQ